MKKFNIPLCFFVIFLLLLLPVYSASELAQINGSYENVKDESIGEVIESTIENNNSTISESDLKEGIISQDLNNNCNYAQEFWPSGAIGNIEPQKDNDWWRIYVGKGKLTVDLDTSIWLFGDDFDLYVYESCNSNYICRPYLTNSHETCVIDTRPGWYYINVDGFKGTGEYFIDINFEGAKQYDLAPINFQINPSSPKENDLIDITYGSINYGSDEITDSFNYRLYIDNSFYETCRSNGRASGKTGSCTKEDIKLSAGFHTLKVDIDPENYIKETNENNNMGTFTLEVKPSYDLTSEQIIINPSSPDEDDLVGIRYSVRNTGNSDITSQFKTQLSIDNLNVHSCFTNGLTKGNQNPCEITNAHFPSGSYTAKIEADSNKNIAESNEFNNILTKTFIVAEVTCPIPDGSSSDCDCNYNYECPSSHPYCEDLYPSPISDNYDACLTSPPIYCGDNLCNNGETWQSCQVDCNAPIGKVFLDVDHLNGNPVSGSKIYLGNTLKGATDSNGKIDFSAGYGQKTVNVYCPNENYCGSKSVYVDGDEYLNFKCDCGVNVDDSDNDGVPDEDEILMGTDPYNSNSQFGKSLSPFTQDCLGCFVLSPILGIFASSKYDVDELSNSLKDVSIQEAESIFSTRENLVNHLNVDNKDITDSKTPLYEIVEYEESVTSFQSGEYIIFIVEKTQDGREVIDFYAISARCSGNIVGLLAGAGYGVKDDLELIIVDLPKLVWEGLVYFSTNAKSINVVVNDASNLFSEIVTSFNLNTINSIFYDVMISIFEKGRWVTQTFGVFKTNPGYANFQVGFFQGYVVGYIGEQVAALFIGVGEVSKAVRAFKAGSVFTNTGGKIYKYIPKMVDKFGDDVAKVLTKSKYVRDAAEWGDDLAESGFGRLGKHFDDTGSFDRYLDSISNVKRLSQTFEQFAVTHGDEAAKILVSSSYGKKALQLGWSLDELSGLSSLTGRFGDDFIQRAAGRYGDTTLREASSFTSKVDNVHTLVGGTTDVKLLSELNKLSGTELNAIKIGIGKVQGKVNKFGDFAPFLRETEKAEFIVNIGKISKNVGDDVVNDLLYIHDIIGADKIADKIINAGGTGFQWEARGTAILKGQSKPIKEISISLNERLGVDGELDLVFKNGDVGEFKQGWLANSPNSGGGQDLLGKLKNQKNRINQFQSKYGGKKAIVYSDVKPDPNMLREVQKLGYEVVELK